MDKQKREILREKYAGSFGGKRDHMNFQDEATVFIDGKKVRRFYTAKIRRRTKDVQKRIPSFRRNKEQDEESKKGEEA